MFRRLMNQEKNLPVINMPTAGLLKPELATGPKTFPSQSCGRLLPEAGLMSFLKRKLAAFLPEYQLSCQVGPSRDHSPTRPPLALLAVPRMEIELTSCRADGNWTWLGV